MSSSTRCSGCRPRKRGGGDVEARVLRVERVEHGGCPNGEWVHVGSDDAPDHEVEIGEDEPLHVERWKFICCCECWGYSCGERGWVDTCNNHQAWSPKLVLLEVEALSVDSDFSRE